MYLFYYDLLRNNILFESKVEKNVITLNNKLKISLIMLQLGVLNTIKFILKLQWTYTYRTWIM